LRLRAGVDIFLDWLREKKIPLIIMSAAPGYMLEQYLRQGNQLDKNVHIIANEMLFDPAGKFTGIAEPIIHSLNKYEIILKEFPVFKEIKDRKNVLLLGDQPDDVGMITGFPYKTLLKIGFLNEKSEEESPERLKQFTENFDIVLTGDPGLEYINELLKETF
jgi:HAD superfamily hydrolase (TIGR01544 family)